jgi:hypothetical protein
MKKSKQRRNKEERQDLTPSKVLKDGHDGCVGRKTMRKISEYFVRGG